VEEIGGVKALTRVNQSVGKRFYRKISYQRKGYALPFTKQFRDLDFSIFWKNINYFFVLSSFIYFLN